MVYDETTYKRGGGTYLLSIQRHDYPYSAMRMVIASTGAQLRTSPVA